MWKWRRYIKYFPALANIVIELWEAIKPDEEGKIRITNAELVELVAAALALVKLAEWGDKGED